MRRWPLLKSEFDAHQALTARARHPRPQIIDPPAPPPISLITAATWAALILAGVGLLTLSILILL